MKIDALKIIEDALIGGRNGEMAFIENNPLVAQLYRESGKTFREFIKDIVDEKEDTPSSNKTAKRFILYKQSIRDFTNEEDFNNFEKTRKLYDKYRKIVNEKATILCVELKKHPFFKDMVGYPYTNSINYKYNEDIFYGYIDTSRLMDIT